MKSSSTQVKTATFVVEGQFLTDHARSWVLSDDHGRAWRLLRESLQHDDDGAVLVAVAGILDGSKRLVGDTNVGIELEDDRTKAGRKYAKDVAFIYAGRVRINGGWYRPVAKIEGMGQRSAMHAAYFDNSDKAGSMGEALANEREWWLRRARFYADVESGEMVVATESPGRRSPGLFFVFAPCTEPPIWITPVRDVEDALGQWKATGHRLDDRCGHIDVDEKRREPTDEIVQRVADNTRDSLNHEQDLFDAARRSDLIAKIRADVLAQAGDDTFELVATDRTWLVPRAPFVAWALGRTKLRGLAPNWNPISPAGLKLMNDNPYHSDWMIGAGYDIDSEPDYHDSPLMDAAMEESFRLQGELGEFAVHVLSSAPECEGYVGDVQGAIFILKDLRNSPENNAALNNARAIITENGGALSHLSIVAREMRIPIFRVADATKRFAPGTKLRMNSDEGTVEVLYAHGGEL